MESYLNVVVMVLRGLSTAIIDIFFVMTVFVAFMTVYRFYQYNAADRPSARQIWPVIAELTVQGIVIGAVYGLMATGLGFPVLYSDYLYFLLPMAFIIGFYHIRYTNLIYAALALTLIGSVMNGQDMGEWSVPNVTFGAAGLMMMTGTLMLMLGIVLYMTGTKHLKPVVVHVQGHRKLGFGMQRFWPVPIVLLAAIAVPISGDAVTMPAWWPLLKMAAVEGEGFSLFLLPLLLVMSHGSISFSHSPGVHARWQAVLQMAVGGVLALAGYLLADTAFESVVSILLLMTSSAGLEILWNLKEGEDTCIYDLTDQGVYIVGVEQDSPAKMFGLMIGDRISEVNGEPVESLAALQVMYKTIDENRVLTIERYGQSPIQVDTGKRDILTEAFGLRMMPDNPRRVFDYKVAVNMNMMHVMNLLPFKGGG